jgi:hypothetical protein
MSPLSFHVVETLVGHRPETASGPSGTLQTRLGQIVQAAFHRELRGVAGIEPKKCKSSFDFSVSLPGQAFSLSRVDLAAHARRKVTGMLRASAF